VDDYRYGNRIPTRTEAIRQILEKGLKEIEKEKNKTLINTFIPD
jgi:hypothetical protein